MRLKGYNCDSITDTYLDWSRLPLLHTLPKEGNHWSDVSAAWLKLAPTLFGGSFFFFSFSTEFANK